MAATGVGCLIVYGRGAVGGYGNFTALSGLFPNVKGQYLLVPAEGPLILRLRVPGRGGGRAALRTDRARGPLS